MIHLVQLLLEIVYDDLLLLQLLNGTLMNASF
jgi:hypothetical protein